MEKAARSISVGLIPKAVQSMQFHLRARDNLQSPKLRTTW